VLADDIHFMELALEEAKKGRGRTSPNPCVGAIIVKNGSVVGRGYHEKAGTAHAEVHALADAGSAAKGATIYVTLEPCNHTGRTPPCSHAVLGAGISRVVIGLSDPNPLAKGGGEYLMAHGVEVVKGVCEKKCRQINYPFIKHVTTGLPWVIMKAGMSLDGRITYQKGRGQAITGKKTKTLVHSLRDRTDAILIGVETACVDNPSLTTRLNNNHLGHDPLRVILDSQLRLNPESTLLTQESSAETWVFCCPQALKEREVCLQKAGAVIFRVAQTVDGYVDLAEVLALLGKNNVTSLLVEGGAGVHGSFLRHGLVDEVYLFLAPFFIGDTGTLLLSGYSASTPESVKVLQDVSSKQVEKDILIHGLFPD
jgi:diaminohydroxyphosphoribosylaminopyrimidine deaminase/5-amino-6-(5-phosphoribosylamino)uracil reductase